MFVGIYFPRDAMSHCSKLLFFMIQKSDMSTVSYLDCRTGVGDCCRIVAGWFEGTVIYNMFTSWNYAP